MSDKEVQILEQVEQLFMKCGVKSLTMDDVARHLTISKKTLYQFVANKNDLVCKSIERHFQRDKEVMQEICSKAENAIEEIFLISKHVGEHLKGIHPSVLFDLQKYYPEAWKLFDQYKQGYVYNCMATNMERGIKEGYFRENLNIPIVARIYVGRIDLLFDQLLFPRSQFEISDVYLELIRYHVRGITSKKGTEYLVEKFQDIDSKNSKNFMI